MADHLVAYVQRRLITSWKRCTLNHPIDGQPAFLYSSDDCWQFAPFARRGATLWVIASHPPDPPALVARLDDIAQVGPELQISDIPRRLYRHFNHRTFVVKGSQKSRFFGHNDVSRALLGLTYLDKFDDEWRLTEADARDASWKTDYGNLLIRPVRVAGGSAGAAELTRHAKRMDKRSVFISYKRRDHRWRLIRKFARELIERDYAVWLDRIALPAIRPRKRTTRKFSKREEDRMLTILLRHGMGYSKVLAAVSSPHYGVPSQSECEDSHCWTADEWNGASRSAPRPRPSARTVWRLDPPAEAGVDLARVHPFSRSKSPRRAAEDFDRWFASRSR
jgi:hypothetical protein